MSEQVTSSLEDQLLDAQMHVGRLENELALALKGIAPELRWSTMRPAMSGVYLNSLDGLEEPQFWQVVSVDAAGNAKALMVRVDKDELDSQPHTILGPYFAGPLKIGAPE